jgi:uncharacterized protein YjbI with pentapeptide repeats
MVLAGLQGDSVDFSRADLGAASLTRARLVGCRFERALLEKADLTEATLRTCRLDGARAAGACLARARIEDSSAEGADLTDADLRGAHLTETSWARAVLRGACLEGAQGVGTSFRGADLSGVSLVGARLDEADFRGADLRGANLSGGRFQGADFRGAVLEGVRWDGSDCTGALFDAETSSRPSSPAPEPAAGSFDAEAFVSWLAGSVERTFKDVPAVVPETPAQMRESMAALQRLLVVRGVQVPDLSSSLEPLVQALESEADEPPQEWKAWLEELASSGEGERPLDVEAVLRSLRDRLHKP